MPSTTRPRLSCVTLGLLAAAAAVSCAACAAQPIVTTSLPVRRVIVYRNGVAYFQRSGHVDQDEVRFKMKQSEVGDFLATLTVMESGGSSVRGAEFPLKVADEEVDPDAPRKKPTADEKRGLETVVLALDGRSHDLRVGYVAASPVWKPSYRLVVHPTGDADLQAWGIVENLSGEDWKDVRLSLIAGAPVSFRADLGTPVTPERPAVTDNGEVIAAVPHAETSLAQGAAAMPAADGPGAKWGSAIGDSFGAGGLGLSGVGEGGGGRGEGIGLGGIGAIGHGAGVGTGEGFGNGHGRLGGAHQTAAPTIRQGATQVSGRLPAEVIQRIVRQNFGRFRLCYENGLRSNPNLAGRVSVKFTIDKSGSVGSASDGGSELPDATVVACIVRGFGNLSFPQPDGGTVTVVYPVILNPGDEGGSVDATRRQATAAAAPEPTSATSTPRSLGSLAAVATQAGVTRYTLPLPVTVPDRSATMVMLLSRPVSGESIFLFAPDVGVPDSASHPFRVARFVNSTPGVLERGPIAVFEDEAFLGQGMVDPLPVGATATVPFALERSLAVDVDRTYDEQGARVAKIETGALTIDVDRVTQTKYRVRNGGDAVAKVLVRHPRTSGARLFTPPAGTEDNVGTGTALVPTMAAGHGTVELVVDERLSDRRLVEWFGAPADSAVKAYLKDPKAEPGAAKALSAAWLVRADIVKLGDERNRLNQEANDRRESTEETRRNLGAIEKNRTADVLRQKLTARLAEEAARIDNIQRRVAELDSKLAELTVQFREGVRALRVTMTPGADP